MLHSSLRNVIERCFGVLKQRWKMLDRMAPFSYLKQVKIVIAAMTLHNFIVEQNMSDELLSQFSQEDLTTNNCTDNEIVSMKASGQDTSQMEEIRDCIRDSIATCRRIN